MSAVTLNGISWFYLGFIRPFLKFIFRCYFSVNDARKLLAELKKYCLPERNDRNLSNIDVA